jgi:hypothetical protein
MGSGTMRRRHIQGGHPLKQLEGIGTEGARTDGAAVTVIVQDEGSLSTCPGGTLQLLLLRCISSRNSLDQTRHQGSLWSGGDTSGVETHLVKYEEQASASEIRAYQQVIGSLLYIQIGTRLDISFAVSRLVQYASNPSPQHMRLAKYVLAYLRGTADLQLRYDGARGEGLHGYSDSSLGDQADDYHSTSGYVFLLANAAISWCSRKQKTVAQSTTQAEYMALAEAVNQAAWYQSFLMELGYEVSDPIPLHGDNKGAVDLALNPVTGRRSKHIPIKHHAIRKYVEEGLIDLIHTPTNEMLADGLTKPHVHVQLSNFVTGLGLT